MYWHQSNNTQKSNKENLIQQQEGRSEQQPSEFDSVSELPVSLYSLRNQRWTPSEFVLIAKPTMNSQWVRTHYETKGELPVSSYSLWNQLWTRSEFVLIAKPMVNSTRRWVRTHCASAGRSTLGGVPALVKWWKFSRFFKGWCKQLRYAPGA
jgi:hypothetical protein